MNLAVWRDLSLIWLIFLTLIAVLPFGVIFYYAVRGLRRLRQLALLYLPVIQEKARTVADVTEGTSSKIAEPIVGMRARAAQANGIRKAIFARRKPA